MKTNSFFFTHLSWLLIAIGIPANRSVRNAGTPEQHLGSSMATFTPVGNDSATIIAEDEMHFTGKSIAAFRADIAEGIIGTSNEQPVDNPYDNVFHVYLPSLPGPSKQVYLSYQLSGISNHTGITRSINDEQGIGGRFVKFSKGWRSQKEQISSSYLRKGDNVIRFGLPTNAEYCYSIRNLSIIIADSRRNEEVIVINQPDKSYFGSHVYLKGIIKRLISDNEQQVLLYCDEQLIPVYNNEFEAVLHRPANAESAFSVQLKAIFPSGKEINKTVNFSKNIEANRQYLPEPKGITNLGQYDIDKGIKVTMNSHHGPASITIPGHALPEKKIISITALRDVDLPPLNPDLVNVTKGSYGFRFLPHASRFSCPAQLSIPFDSTLIPEGYTAADIRSYYFDESSRQWLVLPLDSILVQAGMIWSRTLHFTDMINGIIKVPESPQTQGYTPTSIKDLKAADPTTGIQLIEAPSANQMGTANLSYPIQVPAGRHGLSPGLAVNYNSGSGNGWMGLGWNLNIPAISIETRWGVPRYDPSLETETYTMMGEQLAPLAYRDAFKPRSTEKRFYPRVEGSFMKIIRHGDNPKNYWWEVTDKSGTRYCYGGTVKGNRIVPNALLTDDEGNIAYWGLVETRDLNDNFIHYEYTTIHDAGVIGSNVTGRELYIDKISYTGHGNIEGRYSVHFTRDNEMSDPTRLDVQINGRLGFKRVTSRLLRKIEVKIDDRLIRKYEFSYLAGPFSKTLLHAIVQYDAAGIEAGEHSFTYFNEVEQNGKLIPLKSPQRFNSPDDGIDGEFISGFASGGDKATNLGAIEGNDRGFGLYIGFGPYKLEQSTSMTAGFHFNNSHSRSKGRLSLVDINGDGQPDKVFEKNGALFYRPQIKGGTLFGEAKQISGVNSFLQENSETNSVGLSSNFYVYAGLNYSRSTSSTSAYLADANGDGLADVISSGNIRFNNTDRDGEVSFSTSSSNTHAEVNAGNKPDPKLIIIDPDEQETLIDDNPLNDIVRRWTAPATGSIVLRAPVTLIENETAERQNYSRADGVRVAIQKNEDELWSARIDANDYTAKTPPVSTLKVNKGDRLYFRVQSKFDGAYDQVLWNPVINYSGQDTTLNDANRKPLYHFNAAEDYVWTGSGIFEAPIDGTIKWQGVYHQPKMSDTVWNLVIKNKTDTLYQARTSSDTSISFNKEWNINRKDKLEFKVYARSNVNWPAIQYDARIYYTASREPEVPDVKDNNGTYFISLTIIPNLTIYGKEYYPAKQWVGSGNIVVAPLLAGSIGTTDTGYVTLSVKKKDTLLAEKTYSLQDIRRKRMQPVAVKTLQTDTLFIEYTADRFALLSKINNWNARVNATVLQPAVYTVHHPDTLLFGSGYRNWTAFSYNGNRARADRPIVETEIRPDKNNIGPNEPIIIDTAIKDPAVIEAQFRASSIFDARKAKFIPLNPSINKSYSGYDEFVYIHKDTLSASRMGDDDILVINPLANTPDPGKGELSGIEKTSKSNSWSLSFGGGIDFISLSYCHTENETKSILDYMDLNGDRYPDVVGEANIQYSNPTGGLSSLNATTNIATQSESSSDVLTFGGRYPKHKETASTQCSGSANTTPYTTPMPVGEHAKAKGNSSVEVDGGIGANIGTGDSHSKFSWNDINGDGLMDKVHEDGIVELNIGYKFLPGENWGTSKINEGKNVVAGLHAGININNSSFEAGIGVSSSENDVILSYSDVNGDGLADQIVNVNPLRVKLNTGSGFGSETDWTGASQIARNLSLTESANAAFTINIPLFPFLPILSIAINPSVSISQSFSTDKYQLTDLDGDGYPDYLSSESENELTVSYSTIGKTNLLKEIKRPLGAAIRLDYGFEGNTYDMPQRVWVLKSTEIFDGLKGDGIDTLRNRFSYDSGFYNRNERDFYGFKTVSSQQLNSDNSIYRSHVQTFLNRGFLNTGYNGSSYYTRSLLKSEWLEDEKGLKYTETINYYDLRLIADSVRFPALVKTDKIFYEANSPGQVSTSMAFDYDAIGNITDIKDAGDGEQQDMIMAKVTYHDNNTLYIKSIPKSIVVTTVDGEKRRRTTAIDQNGNITRINQFLSGGTASTYDLKYDEYGNLSKITRPVNYRDQRMWYAFEYDDIVHSYTTKVSDAFGYSSTSTYDLRFGAVTGTVSLNSEPMRYTLDDLGRLNTVTGPYELAANKDHTIRFEYYPYAPVPYSITHHFDTEFQSDINTISFSDGLGRSVQVKKMVSMFKGKGVEDELRMVVSGSVLYDAFGRAIASYFPITELIGTTNNSFSPSTGNILSTTSYDIQDRPVKTVLADGAATTMEYSIANNMLVTKTTDALGHSSESFADVRGRKRSVKVYGGPDGVITTGFLYNALSELIRTIDNNGNLTRYSYDNLGRKLSILHPDAGLTSFEYDPAGNLLKKITAQIRKEIPKGGAIQYQYDYERLSGIDYPRQYQNKVSYSYGPAEDTTATGKLRAGRLTLQEDASGGQEFYYGRLGEITKVIRTMLINPVYTSTYVSEQEYDTWNRIKKMVYPDGETVTYYYNRAGGLKSFDGYKSGNAYQYVNQIGYDEYEQRVYLLYGNGTETSYAYDSLRRRLTTLQAATTNGHPMMNNSYQYDFVSNILGIVNDVKRDADKLGGYAKQQYYYDGLNRLDSASGLYKGYKDSSGYSLKMGYDNLHNIVSKKLVDSIPGHSYEQLYSYGGTAPHQPTQIGKNTYHYDANGNQLGNDSIENFWDEENRLMAVINHGVLSQYTYDAGGERAIKSSGGIQGIWVNGAPAGTVRHNENYTAYVSPYLVCRRTSFTKHYYIESQRVVTKLGHGDFANISFPEPVVTAGSIDYRKRAALIEKSRTFYYANLGVSPGPPTDKYFYAKPENSGIAAPVIIDTTAADVPRGWPGNTTPPPNGPPTNAQPIPSNAEVKAGYGFRGTGHFYEKDQYFYHPDHLGSTSYVTDVLGEVNQHAEYSAFGETFFEEHASSFNTPYLFNAKERDAETGYYYYGARYYDPKVSQWISVDPEAGRMPLWSPYSYSLNNPVLYVDPNGKIPIIPWLLKAGAGAASDVLAQATMSYLFDANVSSWSQAFDNVNWYQVGRSGLEGLIPWKTPGGRLGRAASTASIDVLVNAMNNPNGYTSEQAGLDFATGFIGDLAGGGMGDLLNKYGAKKIANGLMNKLGMDYGSVMKMMGGGARRINKTINGITSTRMMQGWAKGKVAVIGRGMDHRVIPFADGLGAEYWKEYNRDLSETVNLLNNRKWVQNLKDQGYTIYDIGTGPRSNIKGEYYEMETREIFGDK